MKNLRIKTKLYIIIAIVMVPLLAVQYTNITNNFSHRIDMEMAANQDFAEALSELFRYYVKQIWTAEWPAGLTIAHRPWADAAESRTYLEKIMSQLPAIKTLGWINTDGILEICTDKGKEGSNIEGRDYYQRISNGEDMVISALFMDQDLGLPVFVIARGIRENGRLRGIMAAEVCITDLDQILPSRRASKFSTFGLIEHTGKFVYMQGLANIASKMITAPQDSPCYKAIKGEKQIIKKGMTTASRHSFIGAYVPIQGVNWVIFASTNYDKYLASVYLEYRNQIIFLLILTIVTLYLAISISRQIINPALLLEKAANKISAGDFSVRTNIEGHDELAAAGKAFDHMVNSIEEYDRLKTQFFANLSHEFKTPLNIILASLQLVNRVHQENTNCSNYEKLRNYFGMMQQNCYRLLRLINNLIDITKLDAGFMKNSFARINIVALIEDITLSVVKYAEAKGIHITFDTEPEEKFLICDPDKIERIILNLLSNAIKFTKPGGSVWVNLYDGQESILISVKDNGIGIPEDKLKIVFERFRQVDTSLHRENEGSGIGLSLVKALVEALEGSIEVKSVPGEGSEFIIALPVVEKEDTIQTDGLKSNNMDRVQKIEVEFSDIYSN